MNRVVIVTGGTSGIGKEVVKIFTKQGDKVVIFSLNATESDRQWAYSVDVSKEEEVKGAIEKVVKNFGKIDILINCAGFGVSGASELIPTSSIQNIFDVNVIGTILCSKHALPHMSKGAKIINIASAMAFFPLPFRTMYAATKSAVVTLSYGMRMELKSNGIDVTAIAPGDVKTNFTKNRVKFYETNDKYGNRIENAANDLDSKEEKRMSPNKVAEIIIKQANKKHSKHLVIVGGKYKILYILQKIFPTGWVLKITDKFFGGYKK